MKPRFKLKGYTDADGLSVIYLYYYNKEKQTFIDTGVKTKPEYFTGTSVTSKCADIKQDQENLNNLLRTCMNKVEGIILQHKLKYQIEPTVDILREEYYKDGEKQNKELNVIDLYENWITFKGSKIRNTKIFTTILKDLQELYPSGKLYFRNLDNSFFERLVKYWQDVPIQNSTINKRLSCFKNFLKKQTEIGNNEYQFFRNFRSELKNLNTRVNIVILTGEELKTFETHVFKRKALSYVRDLYLVSCSTGLRFSDVIRLSPYNFFDDASGDKWVISDITKTEELQIRIPVPPLAERILKKYKFQFRKISNQKANVYLEDALKECNINELVPIYSKFGPNVTVKRIEKYKAVNFHSSRKYYITTAVNSGIEIGDVMEWSGHTSGTISKYITKGNNQQKKVRTLFK